MIAVRPYTPDEAECWNELVAQSRNGTFLFDRRYMDYHSDRFADHSSGARRWPCFPPTGAATHSTRIRG